MFHVSIWVAWSFVWGAKPPKAPRGDGTGRMVRAKYAASEPLVITIVVSSARNGFGETKIKCVCDGTRTTAIKLLAPVEVTFTGKGSRPFTCRLEKRMHYQVKPLTFAWNVVAWVKRDAGSSVMEESLTPEHLTHWQDGCGRKSARFLSYLNARVVLQP